MQGMYRVNIWDLNVSLPTMKHHAGVGSDGNNFLPMKTYTVNLHLGKQSQNHGTNATYFTTDILSKSSLYVVE